MSNTYRIVSIDDRYLYTKKINVEVQIVGQALTFYRTVTELYQKEYLDQFSREDVAYIAALYTAEQTNNFELVEQFPRATPATQSSVIVIGILFTAFLILSNLTAFKLATFGSVSFPAGLVFFPLTYVFDDILTEVYGFKISRRIIWMALLANTIIFIGTWLTIYLPPSSYWHNQQAYATVYHATLRVFLASMIGYFCGEFANSIILAKLKILTLGKYLWLRAMSSTMIGVGIDTIIFIHIAFALSVPYSDLWKIILTMYSLKVIYEICAIPITYKVTNFLKKSDNVDHYDFKTKFNPFSLTV